MDKVMYGVVHGRSIDLADDPGVADGQQVRVVITGLPEKHAASDGIRRSAGGWAEYPEMDAIMEQVHQDRQRERRTQEVP